MGELVRLVIDCIAYIWPFRIVKEGETGLWYVRGRFWKEVQPSAYIIIPFFMEIDRVSIASDYLRTGRLEIRLADDKPLCFECRATYRVIDARKMQRETDDAHSIAEGILASVTADRLGQVKSERLAADSRGRLFSDIRRWVQDEASKFGMEIANITFTSMVLDPRIFRLMTDERGVKA